jgi:hypothetical protein
VARVAAVGPGAALAVRPFLARHALAAATALVGVAAIVVAGYRLRHSYVGDAAVYLPFARNAAHGHLFQFNVGEFSSGSTSPLWALLLAIPYLFGVGLMGAKAFAAGFAVLGFLATLVAARQLTRSWTASAIAALFALGTMTFFAASLYESGLVVTLAALSLVAGDHALRRWREEETLSVASLAPLVAVWAALPLARPDAVILVAAETVALFAFAPGPRRRAALTLVAGLALASLPAAVYFGYSLVELGTFSTSSQGRAEALREANDKWIGPLYLSRHGVRELFSSPWVFGVVPALAGLALLGRSQPSRWLAAYGGLAMAGYLALLTFITPGFFDTQRYLVPLVPIVVVGAASLLAQVRGSRLWPAAVLAGVLAIGGSAVHELRKTTRFARAIGITEHEVFERDVDATINRLARPGDRVLSYEVQMRYFLRGNVSVLSEDGITDGKVAPYQSSRDMTGFLLRYRPRWWIADRNVTTRRYMKGSVLHRAFVGFQRDPSERAARLDGIGFRLIARRDRPLAAGFGGWQMLFELRYPPNVLRRDSGRS